MEIYLADIGNHSEYMTEELRECFRQLVRKTRLEKAEKQKNQKDRDLSLTAGMLLNVATKLYCEKAFAKISNQTNQGEMMQLSLEDLAVQYDASYDYEMELGNNGKPYFKHVTRESECSEILKSENLLTPQEIHFNLSHAGRYAVCAIGEHPVGIDIEGNRKVRLKTAKRFFTEAEYQWVCGGEITGNQQKRFLRIWTMKEAFSKLTGEGIAYGISKVEFLPDQGGNMTIRLLDSLGVSQKSQGELHLKELEVDGYAIAVIWRIFENR